MVKNFGLPNGAKGPTGVHLNHPTAIGLGGTDGLVPIPPTAAESSPGSE